MALKPISVTNSERVVCLVIGAAGVGKTSLLRTIPENEKVCVLSAESGLLSVLDLVRSGRVEGYEIESLEDLGDAFTELSKPESAERFDWIFLDSLTEISGRVVEHMQQQYPNTSDTFKLWGEYNKKMTSIIKRFRDLRPFNICFTCLPSVDKDERNVRYQAPDIPGKLSQKLPAFFDEVFFYRIEAQEEGDKVENRRFLQTQPIDNYIAKDRSGKLAVYETPDLGYLKNKILAPVESAGKGKK